MKLSKMNKLLNKLTDEPFKYGKSDCYIFTAKLVKEWHGNDYLKVHAVYKNEKEARAYMQKFKGIEALITGMFGYSVDPTTCWDGDIVTAEVASDNVAVGFVFKGNGIFKGKTVIKIPLNKCRQGWRLS